jgi:hypothetical protein
MDADAEMRCRQFEVGRGATLRSPESALHVSYLRSSAFIGG